MDLAIVYYLGVTFLLFAIFAVIAIRTYSRKHKEKGEAPKYRMMEDEWEEKETDDGANNGSAERERRSTEK